MPSQWFTVATALAACAVSAVAQNASIETYTLPSAEDNEARATAIEEFQKVFLYGPGISGEEAQYPAGPEGERRSLADRQELNITVNLVRPNVTADAGEARTAALEIAENGRFTKLDDFLTLHDGWERSVPDGPYPGMLSNYTDDLLFSMERLSVQPFSLRRIGVDADLPFTIAKDVVESVTKTTQSLDDLHKAGRLFIVDYSHLAELERNEKFAASCTAYFYIHPDNDDFLPLAIKTAPTEDGLIYTPADEPKDWLFAKMMFESNDFWHTAWFHFASTHYVFEIAYMAAARTLSEEHPIRPILNRLAEQAFAFRPNAKQTLYIPGVFVDILFPYSGRVAADYTADLYANEAGKFQSNYFRENLRSRGLIEPEDGPELKSFPFYHDASDIVKEIEGFFTAFVDSYYQDSPEADTELQQWIKEANGPAKVRDFPAEVTDKETLVSLLSHMAYLVSVFHQALNTDVPVHSTATLPLHPLAFYKELPQSKGTEDIASFMPNVSQSVTQISLLANFNRPSFDFSNNSLTEMFNNATMLSGMNKETQGAAKTFRDNLLDLSDQIESREFDEDGLSLGMPFIWKTLAPRLTPYWLSV